MMANTIYGMTNYYNLFTNPLSSSQQDPTANFIYGASANTLYLKTYAKKITSQMSSYLTALNTDASDLKSTSRYLATNSSNSSFDQKTLTSSDNSAINGNADSDANTSTYTMNISKLATSQQNSSYALISNASSVFNQGTNTFSIKFGNNTEKTLSFNINESDTNKSSLYKMANSINYSKSGFTASVIDDSKKGTSTLKITSDKTGTNSAFSLADVKGNAVSASGINTNSVQAQNAEYTIDGKKYSSEDNNISLDNGKVKINLNKAEGKDFKISVSADTSLIKSDIADFVSSYNNIINLTNSNSSDFNGALKLNQELSSIINSKSSSLNKIGVSQNSDGTLNIDESKLTKAINENFSGVKDIFNEISDKTYTKTNEVLTSPAKYSSPSEINGTSNKLYGNISASQSGSTALQNAYRGMIINMLI